jgi:hypothetical protein
MLQMEQHQVMGVVLSWVAGVVIQEAHVEAWVWETVSDLEELACWFILKGVVVT